jgi:hypothetical protein
LLRDGSVANSSLLVRHVDRHDDVKGTDGDRERLGRSSAMDNHGDLIGVVVDVYEDPSSRRPAWLAISTGFFGTRVAVVPLRTPRCSVTTSSSATHGTPSRRLPRRRGGHHRVVAAAGARRALRLIHTAPAASSVPALRKQHMT